MSKPATAAVRCYSLTLDGQGNKTLKAQELHGKRMDGTSKARRVRRAGPLVYGGLDLRDLYDDHMDGVRLNASCKRPVLHFIIKMPEQVLADGEDAPERYRGKTKKERQALMARQAVRFINETHGGDAVFAARVDRDEAGELIVDIFAAPKYEKATKKAVTVWASPTKYGKELAIKHQSEIAARHSKAKGLLTGPRHVGIALQAEFAEFFERENGMTLTRKAKDSFGSDRLETEAYKEVRSAQDDIENERAKLEREEKALQGRRKKLEDGFEHLRGELADREARLDVLAADIRRKSDALTRLRDEISGMIGETAKRLGVASTFAAIRDRISAGLSDVEDPFEGSVLPDPFEGFLSPQEEPREDAGPGF